MLSASPLRIALLAALFACLPAQAQIYQYKDAAGRTVISDRPPPAGALPAKAHAAENGVSTSEDPPATDGANAAAPPKTLADREMEFRKRQQAQREAAEKAQKESADKARRKEDCERAQRQLRMLESGERIALRDEKGERVFLEDVQRTAEIERTRRMIADACR
ncbi:MAG: DUF4124 domain-containing protein [Rhodocyclaceae bacterium]|nr:DUF4124 domain-containing protein [Rhodocyclaceae bacterium]